MSDFVQTSTSAVSTPVDSSFVDAAACGDLEEIKRSLANETLPASTINCLDKDGRSAFHYACLNDDVPLLTVLLADARVNVNLCSPNGDTGLHMSSLYAALSAMALLFQDGRISINAQNKYGETSLHLCAGSGDKGAAKAAKLLLEAGASLLIKDKWNRGPVNVAKDNAENPLVQTFNDWLSDHPDQKEKVDDITSKYKSEDQSYQEEQDQARKQAKNAIFGAFGKGFSLGDVKLKKTEVVEKSIFAPSSATGTVSSSTGSNSNSINSENNGPRKRPLSKLIDFPGDLDEIKKFLEDPEIDPCGNDSYGIPALHKFASWNKTVYLDLLIPKLTTEQLNAKADGKTALHWAVEMAAVGAVQQLVRAGIDKDAKDSNGRTVKEILDHNESSGVIERLKAALQG